MIGHFATLRMKGLNANPTKWPKSKQNCLCVFDHFVGLAPKGSPPKYIYDICKKKPKNYFAMKLLPINLQNHSQYNIWFIKMPCNK